MLVMFIVFLFTLMLPMVDLANLTSMITLSIFAMINLALWRIKNSDPRPEGVYIVPKWIPVT